MEQILKKAQKNCLHLYYSSRRTHLRASLINANTTAPISLWILDLMTILQNCFVSSAVYYYNQRNIGNSSVRITINLTLIMTHKKVC